jgi:hypothetical protein
MREKLEELARLHAAATPGEWQVSGSHIYGPDPERVLVAQTLDWPTNSRDYIAAIHNAFPAILEYVRELERERDRLRLRDRKLSCLEAGGVDNWDGYDFAMEEYNQ